jgi:hypothetical protein
MSAVGTLIDLLAGRRDPAALEDRDWEAVISVARAEALAATLAERLKDAALPEAVAALFADLRAAAEVQQVQALWEAEMARRALEPAGVRFVLLKGTAYVAAGLSCADGRQIGDLDILVAREDLDRAEAALLGAGWEWVTADPYDVAYYRTHMHELPPLIHRDRDRMIDVHHTILPLTHRATPDAKAMLAASVPLPLAGGVRGGPERTIGVDAPDPPPTSPASGRGDFGILSQSDRVIHCAAHVMADGDLVGGLRNLWDFHLLMADFDQASSGDWPALIARAEQHQLAPAVHRACALATHLFGTPIPARWARAPSFTDRLFLRALTARDDWGRATRPFSRLAFYIRSHWLRMPPLLLARHLWVKWRRG